MGKHASYKGVWSEEEIKYLKENWETVSREDMAKFLGRSLKAVTKKIHEYELFIYIPIQERMPRKELGICERCCEESPLTSERSKFPNHCQACYYYKHGMSNKEKYSEIKRNKRKDPILGPVLREIARIKNGDPERRAKSNLASRIWYKNNPEKVKEHNRKAVEKLRNNKELKVARAIADKAWRDKNKSKVKQMARNCYLKNKDNRLWVLKRSIRLALWQPLTDLGLVKAKRTFEMLGSTAEKYQEYLDSFIGKPCQCGIMCEGKTIITYENSHIDHIIPLAEAKTEEDVVKLNQIENLQRICDKCNLTKSDYLPQELEKLKNKE